MVAPWRGIQDSRLGFWIPHRGFRILSTGFQSLSLEWIILSRIPDSFCYIPDSKAQESGFHKQKFPDWWVSCPCDRDFPFSLNALFLFCRLKRSVMVNHHASFTPRMMSLKTLALGPKSIWPFDINVVSEIQVSVRKKIKCKFQRQNTHPRNKSNFTFL